jgi:RNA 3'-terminal phosphate cyclase (ATP)
VIPGEYRFQVGTAGSATLVLQTVLPALLTASGPSTLHLEGGTHNPWAPPFDFLDRAFLPCLRRMGPRVHAVLERPGFYPAGGGRFQVVVEPARHLERIEIPERGEIRRKTARALVAHLPIDIGQREIKKVRDLLSWDRESSESLRVEEVTDSDGPGNALMLEIESEHITEVFTGFGERGVPADLVAERVVREARRYLASGVPVGEHLADQLLLPMALAGGGGFRTLRPSRHTTTNIDVIRAFLDVGVRIVENARDDYSIEVTS